MPQAAFIRSLPTTIRTPFGNFRSDPLNPMATTIAMNEAQQNQAAERNARGMAEGKAAVEQAMAEAQAQIAAMRADAQQRMADGQASLSSRARPLMSAPRFDYSAAESSGRPSLLTDNPKGLSAGDQSLRDYYLNLGLNPDNPGERLTTGTPGADIGMGRRTNALTAGFFFKPGERRLSHGEADRALVGSIQNGSDGALDWNDPKWHEKFGQAIPQSIKPTRERNGRREYVSPNFDAFRAHEGYDPFATPEEQAQSIVEHVGKLKSRENSLAGTYRENLRTLNERDAMGALRKPAPAVDLGGTMETGGRSFRVPAGGGPMFETTPVQRYDVPRFEVPAIEDTMTPEAFVNPKQATNRPPASRRLTSLDGTSDGTPAFGRSAVVEVSAPQRADDARPDFSSVSSGEIASRLVNRAFSGGWGDETVPFGAGASELWSRGTKRAIWNYKASKQPRASDLYGRSAPRFSP